MATETISTHIQQPADRLFALVFQHWDEEGDDARVLDTASGNTASARDRHLAHTRSCAMRRPPVFKQGNCSKSAGSISRPPI